MNRSRSVLTGLAAVCAGLLVPSTALASDAEIRQTVTAGAAKIAVQERKVARAGEGIEAGKRPTAARLRKFRAAARAEEAVLRTIRRDLLDLTADTEPVGAGRDLMARGLALTATGLDRIEKALGRLQDGGSAKAAKRSVDAATRKLEEGNKLIDQGEPLVGADLTPNPPASAAASG